MNSSQEEEGEEEAGHPRGGSTSKKPTDVTALDFSPRKRKFRRRWRSSIQETKCNPLWKLGVVHAFHETGRKIGRGEGEHEGRRGRVHEGGRRGEREKRRKERK